MNKDIFVVVEQRNGAIQKVSYELISEATKLAADLGEQVVAVLMGYNIADKADSLIHFGAQKVIVIDTPWALSMSSRSTSPTSFCSVLPASAVTWLPVSLAASTPV